ncbi:MAG: glutathione S-transferase family protein [Pseudomonadota bacterium]|jgi:glutathione S-transferase|nr:glutathione S-transferase family protein [Pseudomonadota bacterium]MEC8027703.1 glutathione S-transferase family protein [Pseudomonadota bacterium]MEC8675484.1 glutathione S-transferase family protein [Pseudomonadota bacterium]MED5337149.1 glutathione S-transferase family protein [Pseudomonadota bacterium]MEE3049747.1 glutathione S-transferase family protein [Pseudomonadota bacterium]|tara:strand:- start:1064 stop:1690 length:627 start_codon:yes stop_codon:yes gene_type:complete
MLKIYHAPATRAFRVIWVCEELAIPYEIVPVDFSPAYRASPEWRAMNPVGKVPVMTDGALKMFESGAMMQYVLDRYGAGRLQPSPDSPDHALYLQWCWFAEATFSRPLGEMTNHRREFSPPLENVLAEMARRASLSVAALDQALADRPYLLGDSMSAADISNAYVLRGYRRSVSEDLPTHVQAFFDRMTARDSYARTVVADRGAKIEP